MTIGLNISGGEFGGVGGIHDYQYHYPTHLELEFYKGKGVDLIRLPFRWERMQDALGGSLDLSGDVALLKRVLVDAAALGMDVIIDCHNFGRYGGKAIGEIGGPTSTQFADFWKKMAIELKDYPALVGYDLMNEPHNMPTSTIWKEAAQAATNAIRTVDMSNTIIISGDHWSGAYIWQQINANLIINDPANNIVYQAHQYFDANSSGTYVQSYDGEGAYAMIGVDRLRPFVEWLKVNGLKGFVGEFGVPSNDPRWLEVQKNALDYLNANGLDGTAWSGGSWWSESYEMFTAKPGAIDSAFGDLLENYYTQFDGFETGTTPHPIPPNVVINDVTVNEDAGTMTFTVTRSGDLTNSSSVSFATTDGTAAAGSDYTARSGDLTFAAGAATALITLAVTNDSIVESTETLIVNLTGGTNVNIVDGSGTGTIISDDVIALALSASTVTGTDASETLNGTSSNDIINGFGGNDVINGRGGADRLTGGSGSDRFVFDSSASANGDVITDFTAGLDKLDLRSIDADIHRKGDQKFTWLDTGAFTGRAGQLREYDQDGKHYVAGDTNGDGIADFTIEVIGTANLTSADFLF